MAYEDDTQRNPSLIFLAGPIKYWWTCWGSPEHREYAAFRERVREILVELGYLTYAPWDAFKGAWTERAQAINDAAISASALLIVMTPPGTPAFGTSDEVAYARRVRTPVMALPSGPIVNATALAAACRQFGLTATPY